MAGLLCLFCKQRMSIMDHRLINSNKIWQKYQKGEGKKNNTFSTWTQKSPLKDSEINVTAKNKQSTYFSTTGCFCCREPRLTVHLLMFSKGIYSFPDLKSLTISFLVPWSINIKISPLMRPERNYLGKVVPLFVMEPETIRNSKGVGAVSADEARRLPDDRCRVTFGLYPVFLFFTFWFFLKHIFRLRGIPGQRQHSW